MSPEQKDAIKGIVVLFDQAENKIKEVEQFVQELSIPSINELRYVGYHLARALSESDDEELGSQIAKAENHCKRAIYDAHEMGIIYMLEQVKKFKENYTVHSSVVFEVLPDYVELLTSAEDASQFIAEIQKKHHDHRDNYYDECVPHYKELRSTTSQLMIAEPLINSRITEKREIDIKATRRFVITVVLSLLGLLILVMKYSKS